LASSAYQGSFFKNDFVESSIAALPDWQALSDVNLTALQTAIRGIFARFPTHQTPPLKMPTPDEPEPPLNQAANCLENSDDGHSTKAYNHYQSTRSGSA